MQATSLLTARLLLHMIRIKAWPSSMTVNELPLSRLILTSAHVYNPIPRELVRVLFSVIMTALLLVSTFTVASTTATLYLTAHDINWFLLHDGKQIWTTSSSRTCFKELSLSSMRWFFRLGAFHFFDTYLQRDAVAQVRIYMKTNKLSKNDKTTTWVHKSWHCRRLQYLLLWSRRNPTYWINARCATNKTRGWLNVELDADDVDAIFSVLVYACIVGHTGASIVGRLITAAKQQDKEPYQPTTM